jgi:hypothetical protein
MLIDITDLVPLGTFLWVNLRCIQYLDQRFSNVFGSRRTVKHINISGALGIQN